jgi:hypothetical protein
MGEVVIHNCETGEITTREMTEEEIAQAKKDEQSRLDLIQAKIDKENARKAILDKLGLTTDEAKLLFGGN